MSEDSSVWMTLIVVVLRIVSYITIVSSLLFSFNRRFITCSASRAMSTSTSTIKKVVLKYDDIAPLVKKIVPPLTYDDHKGSMGRVGVIGGSRDYTGAPYYAASSSLKFGGDLAFVFCSKQAAGPIKTYSPELMVVPFYDDEFVDSMKIHNFTSSAEEKEICAIPDHIVDTLSRIHTLVIGPGLGRNPVVLNSVKDIIRLARSRNIGLVIDADGLWLLNNDLSLVAGYQRCILTPNQAEFTRLVSAMHQVYSTSSPDSLARNKFHSSDPSFVLAELSSQDPARQARALSFALAGVTLLAKGRQDLLTSGGSVYLLGEEGSPRRCGGQGDILAGGLGTALHWALKRTSLLSPVSDIMAGEVTSNTLDTSVDSDSTSAASADAHPDSDACFYAAVLASTVTKWASTLAFSEVGRSMTAPDVLQQVGRAFARAVPEENNR